MKEKDETGDASQRRVHNLQGLLNFCTEVTVHEDRTHETSVELTEERRLFLENVLQTMQGNVQTQIGNCLKKLTENCVNDVNEDVSVQVEALDELSDIAEDINYASDLVKMGGFSILVNILNCPHTALQKGAAQVIGDVCQNNSSGQMNMLPLDAIKLLLDILDTHADKDCKVKALYALSCLIRDCEAAEKQFIDLSGFCYLMRSIQTKVSKLIMKAVFLLNYLVETTAKYQDILLSMGFIEQLMLVLFSDDVDDISREYCTLALVNLASSDDKVRQECLRSEFQLVSQLNERKKIVTGKEEFQEEENHICVLLKLLQQSEESIGLS